MQQRKVYVKFHNLTPVQMLKIVYLDKSLSYDGINQ